MPDPGNLHYGSFKVNLAAGLQHSLIEALTPVWNQNSSSTRPIARKPRQQRMNKRRTHLTEADSDTYTDLTTDRPSYRFLVGFHYMDKGFFQRPDALFGVVRR